DRLADVLCAPLVDVGEHVLAVVRDDRRPRRHGRDVAPADHERHLDALPAHLLEPPAEALALRAARDVLPHRLVEGGRRPEAGVGAHQLRVRNAAVTSTQIMKPSDEAQNVEPTNVQSAPPSQIPSRKTAMPPAIPSRPTHTRTLRAWSAASD